MASLATMTQVNDTTSDPRGERLFTRPLLAIGEFFESKAMIEAVEKLQRSANTSQPCELSSGQAAALFTELLGAVRLSSELATRAALETRDSGASDRSPC